MRPQQEWDEFLHVLTVVGDISPLKGMAKEIVNNSKCIDFKYDGEFLFTLILEIDKEHKHLWGNRVRDELSKKIHSWIEANILGNVILSIKDDIDQIVILPKDKPIKEIIAMYEKSQTNPTHH